MRNALCVLDMSEKIILNIHSYTKMKEGGIISGHDYTNLKYPDIKENVKRLEEIFSQFSKTI